VTQESNRRTSGREITTTATKPGDPRNARPP
jgi:hypothetical protein